LTLAATGCPFCRSTIRPPRSPAGEGFLPGAMVGEGGLSMATNHDRSASHSGRLHLLRGANGPRGRSLFEWSARPVREDEVVFPERERFGVGASGDVPDRSRQLGRATSGRFPS
jgi:hypothetical protein